MENKVYKIIELAGSSELCIEDAIKGAIHKASKTLDHLDWFEVVQIRGCIEAEKIKTYQVIIKIGLRVDAC